MGAAAARSRGAGTAPTRAGSEESRARARTARTRTCLAKGVGGGRRPVGREPEGGSGAIGKGQTPLPRRVGGRAAAQVRLPGIGGTGGTRFRQQGSVTHHSDGSGEAV